MRRVVTPAIASVAASAWIPVDWLTANGSLSLAVVKSGTNTYNIEHTYDDVFDPAVTPTAFIQTSAATTNQQTSYNAPVAAVRVNVTAYTSGAVTMTVLQGGLV